MSPFRSSRQFRAARRGPATAWTASLAVAGFWLALCSPTKTSAQRATVTLSSNATQVTVGQRFRIEARAEIEDGDFEDFELPDLSEFEILGREQRRPFSFSFGLGRGATTRSSVIYGFTVRALTPGKVRLSPARAQVSGHTFSSAPLTIEVRSGPGGHATSTHPATPGHSGRGRAAEAPPMDGKPGGRTVFLRAVADREKVRVGEQVTISYFLYSRTSLRRAPTTTQEPSARGFWTLDLLPPSRTLKASTQEVDHLKYRVYLLARFAAFPLEAGEQTIGPMEVTLRGSSSIFDLLGAPRESVKSKSSPLTLQVEPLPDEVNPQEPWHVGSLNAKLEATPSQVEVGDAVTIRATLSGEGNLKGIRLPSPQLPGFEVLEPKVDDQVTTTDDRVGGTRTFEWLALARDVGEHQISLPDIRVVQPETGSVYKRALPRVVLTVRPGQGDNAQASADTFPDANQTGPVPRQGMTLGTPRSPSRLQKTSPPVHRRGWFWWSLGTPPLLAFAFGAFRGVQNLRRKRGQANAKGALTEKAQAELQAAEHHQQSGDTRDGLAHLERGLRLGLEAAVGQALGAWTFEDMERKLRDAGLAEPVARRATDLLRTSEAAQFTPGTDQRRILSECLERGSALLQELKHT